MPRLPDETAVARTEAAQTQEDAAPLPAAKAGGLLLILGVLWLAATMWGAHASIMGNAADPAVAVSAAANSLPVVVAASMVAGAATGLVVAQWRARRMVGRLIAGLAAGAGCGFAAAAVILFGYGANTSVTVLASTVGAAALLGGAGAALPRPLLIAAIGATIAVFVTSVLINYFQAPLTERLGAGETLASRARAATHFAYAQAALCGLVAGAVAYAGLRRSGGRWAWPAYLLAGAGPGLVLLVAEAVTRLGGASLAGFVRGLSPVDRAVMAYGDGARLRNALIVGFVGGILAMVAFGRTLRPVESRVEEEAED